MTYTKDELAQLSRKELQKLCKQTKGHVKANKKTAELIEDLAEYYSREENEMMEMEAEMKMYEDVDLNGTWTVDDDDNDNVNVNDDKNIEDDNNDVNSDNDYTDVDHDELNEDPESTEKVLAIESKTDNIVDVNTSYTIASNVNDNSSNSSNNNNVNNTIEVNHLSSSHPADEVAENPATDNETAEVNNEDNKDNNDNNAGNSALKEVLMQEVERRAEEKLSKIPRFDKIHVPTKMVAPLATPDAKKRKGGGVKTSDSIDVYLVKKQKRAEGKMKFVSDSKNKENARTTTKQIPSLKSSSLLPKPGIGRRKSMKVDKEVTINFAPQVKSTPNEKRSSPRLSLLKEKSANKRKSVVNNNNKRKSAINKSLTGAADASRRFTVGGFQSPTPSKCQTTPKVKTPKFDLKESLKKPLTYKPHTGKLKPVYFNATEKNDGAGPRMSAAARPLKTKTMDSKVALKDMKTVAARDKRRQTAADKRSKNRNTVLDKRRGIVS